jgi:DNA-directed RNA polymerase subunit RPC12/RpoP
LITNSESVSGYKCVFCGNEDSEELEYICDSCGAEWEKSELSYFDYTDEGDYRLMCPVCLHHPDYVKDM